MARRDERMAANEARARVENESRGDWFETHHRVLFTCECFQPDCDEQISLTREEYERVRSEPGTFAIQAGHVDPTIEHVADRRPTHWVTRKGTAAGQQVAEELDPRSP